MSTLINTLRNRLAPWLAPARQWFDELETRDRRALVVLLGALAVAVLWWLLLQPLVQGRQEARSRYVRASQTLNWMEANAPAIRQARSGAPQQSSAGSDWTSRISSSAAAHELALKGFTPEGQDTVRVMLEDQPLAGVLAWLQTLRREQGVHASSITISQGGRPGGVNVRATLARGG